ncbi:MAG TPA: UTP--glucose-1-phosphate uridylyltransferase [Methylomirabilota bacterium]|jgi:UTP--glucose-1-phosphate uridylyltransferase|nr:UTP--glucose-1-phosphate uridylyltransferase [Methylomirabilota bacterium]
MSDGSPRLKPVRYGVIPAGGLGTRFLPITRTVPKELLPIIDTPVIELVVTEMAAAGISRVVIVSAPGKDSLDAYFRPNERLERRLAVEFRKEDIALLKRSERLATVRVVIQEEAKGNGHAVLQARSLVGAEPFAMLWGDDIVVGDTPAVAQLIEARQRLGGGSVVGTIRVSKDRVSSYGIVAGTPVDERTQRVLAIVEKPKPEDAPSEFAAVHGYVLEPEIFDLLERAKPGRNGEIWLTDAVSELARQGAPVWAIEFQGTQYDIGDKLGYVKAFVDTALGREDLGPRLRAHLKESGWRAPGER